MFINRLSYTRFQGAVAVVADSTSNVMTLWVSVGEAAMETRRWRLLVLAQLSQLSFSL